MSASSSTPRRTWRRLAPTIRSRPNSFVRCATVIESELKIVNEPTTTATPANASRITRRMSTSVSSESKEKRSSSAAVRTSVLGPAAPAMSARRPGDEDAVVAVLGEQRPCGLEVEYGRRWPCPAT